MLNRNLFSISLLGCLLIAQLGWAQSTNPVRAIFPADTRFVANVAYAGDTLKRHQLDLYLPAKAGQNLPLVVWVHGGAWMLNDKYADMSYMKNTVRSILEKGYAFASIDYRYSTTAPFPAQIQDCNQALEFLYQNATKYGYDRNRIALMGFSAGGHLASPAAPCRRRTPRQSARSVCRGACNDHSDGDSCQLRSELGLVECVHRLRSPRLETYTQRLGPSHFHPQAAIFPLDQHFLRAYARLH